MCNFIILYPPEAQEDNRMIILLRLRRIIVIR